MKKYLSKALLYKDWKSVKGLVVLLAMAVALLQYSYARSNLHRFSGDIIKMYYVSYLNYGRVTWITIQLKQLSIYLSIMLIAYYLRDSNEQVSQEKLKTMPFSTLQVVFSKLLVSVIAIAIPIIVGLFITLFVCIGSPIEIRDAAYLSYCTKYLVLNFLMYLSILNIFLLIQTLCNKAKLASVVGIFFIILPGLLCDIFLGLIKFKSAEGVIKFSKVASYFDIVNFQDFSRFEYNEKDIWIKFIVLSVVILASMMLLYKAYKHSKIQNYS